MAWTMTELQVKGAVERYILMNWNTGIIWDVYIWNDICIHFQYECFIECELKLLATVQLIKRNYNI